MTVHAFPQSDRLHRLMRLPELLDGYAQRHPTADELKARRQSAHAALNAAGSCVKRTPRATDPDLPPAA